MITTLAFRHLVVRKLRSLFLLLGFSLGVGVMIVLLSVGEAMLAQSRDVSLVGGGEITVLPQGIDVEAMRTGGLSGMFFGIDRARFLTRQLLGGPRYQALVRVVSPSIEGKLLYLRRHGRVIPVRAGGDIPSRACEVGAGLVLRSGHWGDSPEDAAYITPTRQQLYDQLDHFHRPTTRDSSWGEWHYFNLVTSASEWWYITYLIGGALSPNPEESGRWGGRLLITHRGPNGRYERFSSEVQPQHVVFDTSKADVRLGQSSVEQREGVYHLRARIPSSRLALDLHLTPAANRYFPPVQLQDEAFVSGYVVPALIATGNGRICLKSRCTDFKGVPAYHDHNWGVWRNVTWEWGAARGRELSFLYGGVYGPRRKDSVSRSGGTSPFFLTVWDSLGVKQVLRFSDVRYQGKRPAAGSAKARSPTVFEITATRESDSVQLKVRVPEALATDMSTAGFRRTFLQMRGEFQLQGRLLGETVADSGSGFFETYDLH
jgi:hypothetical protein